jgi:hypothetical protein
MINSSSSPILADVIFDGNTAQYAGGAIYNLLSNPSLKNITYSGNSADLGGAIYNEDSTPSLQNSTFDGNIARVQGGAIYNLNSPPSLLHVTVGENTAVEGGGMFNEAASYPTVSNSIFDGDLGGEIQNAGLSAPQVSRSIIAGGCPQGSTCTGLVNGSPALGPLQDNGGYGPTRAPGAGSAAIDTGEKAACAPRDQRGVLRPQGAACDLGAYEVRAATFTSAPVYDGWVLESGETSGTGGSYNNTASTVRAGDDAANRQYRSILSFNTALLPDTATVVRAKLQARRQGITGDPDPFSTHGSLIADLRSPYFGSEPGLTASDLQAAAGVSRAATFSPTPSSYWYTAPLTSTGRAGINRTGATQFRLRFSLEDDNDHLADYLAFFSGNYLANPAYQPRLIVYYNP